MANFKSIGGKPGERVYRVGTCKKCNIPIFDGERDGPPKEKDMCAFCKGDADIKSKRKIKKKTPGEMLIDLVASRHLNMKGFSTLKMNPEVRHDLATEINLAIEEARNGKAK